MAVCGQPHTHTPYAYNGTPGTLAKNPIKILQFRRPAPPPPPHPPTPDDLGSDFCD
jgi:hypothetical protein